VYAEKGGNRREFCPIEATVVVFVVVVERVLLAVLDSFARDGIEVWRMFWLFQCVVHLSCALAGLQTEALSAQELSGPSWRRAVERHNRDGRQS
jgi:hypothetical protein